MTINVILHFPLRRPMMTLGKVWPLFDFPRCFIIRNTHDQTKSDRMVQRCSTLSFELSSLCLIPDLTVNCHPMFHIHGTASMSASSFSRSLSWVFCLLGFTGGQYRSHSVFLKSRPLHAHTLAKFLP